MKRKNTDVNDYQAEINAENRANEDDDVSESSSESSSSGDDDDGAIGNKKHKH